MKAFIYTKVIILILGLSALSACSHDDYLLQDNGESMSVTFHPTLGQGLDTRAIGDATGIDSLRVVVYQGSETLSKVFSLSEDWIAAQRNGISLTLIEGRTYKILFWAENSENSAYNITDDGKITVDYNDYINGGFAKM